MSFPEIPNTPETPASLYGKAVAEAMAAVADQLENCEELIQVAIEAGKEAGVEENQVREALFSGQKVKYGVRLDKNQEE